MNKLFKLHFNVISFILIILIFTLHSESFAQNNLRIFDDIGGSGSSSQTEGSNDNTAIYVIGGLVLAGILVYALVLKKDNKAEGDTTASLNSNFIYSQVNGLDSPAKEIQKVKDNIPVDLFLGIRNNDALLNERTYSVGLRVKL